MFVFLVFLFAEIELKYKPICFFLSTSSLKWSLYPVFNVGMNVCVQILASVMINFHLEFFFLLCILLWHWRRNTQKGGKKRSY